MTVKSILDIDIQDDKFKEFYKNFQNYHKMVKELPNAWKNASTAAERAAEASESVSESTAKTRESVADTTKETALTVESLVALLQTHNAFQKKLHEEEEKRKKQLRDELDLLNRQRMMWANMFSGARGLERSILNITTSLLKWTSLTGVFSGLAGIGGLFGLENMADRVGAGRKISMGLGIGYGNLRAFQTNYDRIFDPGSVLSGVNSAATDLSKRYSLYGAGLSESDIRGKDTGDIIQSLIPKLKNLVDRTPTSMLAQLSQSRGLENLGFTVQDLERLKATSKGELGEYATSYGRNRKDMDLDSKTQKAWQDLDVQLHTAGRTIENVFIKGLTPLVPSITKLSGAVADALKGFLSNPHLKEDMEDLGKGIQDFAKYLGSSKFRKDLKDFSDGVSYAAKKIIAVARFFGLLPADPNSAQSIAVNNAADRAFNGGRNQRPFNQDSILNDQTNRPFHWYDPGSYLHGKGSPVADWFRSHKTLLGEDASWVAHPNDTNPGNIRVPGQNQGFAYFSGGAAAGIRAIAAQLQLYSKRHIDTINKIVATYAPKSDRNDIEAYAKDLAQRTGYGRDQHLELSDRSVIATLVAAITKHENKKNNYSKGAVVTILNTTGGNATVQTAQLAH